MRILLFPSTGYHNRSPATKTWDCHEDWASSPSLIVTIHRNCNVFSDMGFPSLSGYSIS